MKARVCDKQRRFWPASCAGVSAIGANEACRKADRTLMQKPEAAYHGATCTDFTGMGSETLACSSFAIL